MAKGISIDSPVRMSVYAASRTAKGRYKHLPGKTVGIIAVAPKDYKKGDYNNLIIYFVVNPYRKDLNEVIEQRERKGQLGEYAQSLFDSCFKNWN